ncbi:hypothetical protein [Candidatus Parabeggiatoa sp. HSG14]|uniref:hypothetical protein n=1 Tax=Candidatus Parabeggiatoa sp. HSG14 TaxID=3055593 RepID=UPI0025A69828|nr:hypothetical protein [Thiotrichales bacterium HSG14]
MEYQTLKALKLPLGSGAIENAIHRVINSRLKVPCIFWHRENADKMLMLRSLLQGWTMEYPKKNGSFGFTCLTRKMGMRPISN